MLNLAYDDEQQAVAEMTRDLGSEVLSAAAATTEQQKAVGDEVWQALHSTGLTALVSEDLGGDGIPSAVTQMIAIEQLAHGDPQATIAAVWSGAAAFFVSQHATPGQQETLREAGIGSAAHRGSVALYEADGADELTTTVEVVGDRVRVRGRKVGVPYAERADTMVVVGREQSSGDLVGVLVPANREGVSVAASLGALALDAAELSVVDFDLDVPVDQLLERAGFAVSVARHRLTLAAVQTGMAQRATEYAGEYGSQRIAFGKPIVSFQGVSFLLAEALTRTEQARLEILDAASLIDAGSAPAEVLAAVAGAVSYASENAAETTRNGVQVLGGHGFMTEYPVENWYRIAAYLSTFDFDPSASAFQPAF